jgi:hypothetical protein
MREPSLEKCQHWSLKNPVIPRISAGHIYQEDFNHVLGALRRVIVTGARMIEERQDFWTVR